MIFPSLLASNFDDELASSPTRFQSLESFTSFIESELLLNHRFYFPFFHPLPNLRILFSATLHHHKLERPLSAAQKAWPQEDLQQIQDAADARRTSNGNVPSAFLEERRACPEHLWSGEHIIDHQVELRPTPLQGGQHVFRAVVDHLVSAKGFAQLDIGPRARRRNFTSNCLCDLDPPSPCPQSHR